MASRRSLVVVLASLAVLLTAPAAYAGAPILPRNHSHERVCGTPARGHAHCNAEVVTDATAEPFVSPGPNGYGPADLQAAYGIATAAAQRGGTQTVAVVDAYDAPTAASDLSTYRSTFGLPDCTTTNGCFQKVNQRGGTRMPSANAGWAQETSLDIDMVSAICPQCHILLVEADSTSMDDLGAAADTAARLGATQISNSYGGAEYAGETSDEAHYNHPGVAVTASSGDEAYGAEFPASSRYVTAVGGTTLQRAPASSRGWSETAWSDGGSGCSGYVPKPSFQQDTGCTRRTVADVAAIGDPNTGVAIYDSTRYQGSSGWMVFGGTSAAAPIVAGFDALVGAAAASPSYAYAHAAQFNDVTAGTNGTCGGTYLCTAQAGYDGPTGVGTPSGAVIAGPAAFTQAASGVTGTTATLNGIVNPEGQDTAYSFEYGTTTAYGSRAPAADLDAGAGSGDVAATQDLTGLIPGTTYHYRAVAQNESGSAVGQDRTFTTLKPPDVATLDATGITTGGAKLNGSVTPYGQGTSYRFEYGPTPAYGSATPDADAGQGVAPVAASATLTGLASGRTYHYRLVATSAAGTSATDDATFTTATPPPVAPATPGTPPTTPTGPSTPPTSPVTPITPAPGGGAPATHKLLLAAPIIPKAVRRLTLERRGLLVRVRCATACRIAASLRTPAARPVVVGSGTGRGSQARTSRVFVLLTRAGRRMLASGRAIRLTLRVMVVDSSGRRVTVTRTVRLTR